MPRLRQQAVDTVISAVLRVRQHRAMISPSDPRFHFPRRPGARAPARGRRRDRPARSGCTSDSHSEGRDPTPGHVAIQWEQQTYENLNYSVTQAALTQPH